MSILSLRYEKYYIYLYLGYIMFVVSSHFRIGIVASIMTIWFIVDFLLQMTVKKKCNRKTVSKDEILVLLFIGWATISMLWCDFTVNSLEVSFSKYMNAILPISFYFLGKNKREEKKDFFYYFSLALLICFLLGIYWYVYEPQYYIDYLQRTIYGFVLENYYMDKRFCSFIGSIGIGLLSVCGEILFLNQYYDNKKGKDLVGFLCMFVMCVLSMQRSSYILFAFFFVWILVNNLKDKMTHNIIVFGIILFLVGILVLLFMDIGAEILLQIVSRIGDINFQSMFGSRTHQWKRAFELGTRILIGAGIGSFTQGNQITINDGAYFNILGELGVIGLGLFLFIIISSVKTQIFSNRKKNYIPYMIVIAFLLNGIGSSTILYMDTAALFWFSLGSLRKHVKIS